MTPLEKLLSKADALEIAVSYCDTLADLGVVASDEELTTLREKVGEPLTPSDISLLAKAFVRLFTASRVNQALRVTDLTKREREILLWSARGKRGKEIAQLLGVRLPTVQWHKDQIRKRFGCRTMTEAVAIAMQSGRLKDDKE